VDILNLVHELEERGASLRVLEPAIDTGGPMGRMVLRASISLAQSARQKARARRWPCRLPTPTRCNSISKKSAATSQSARMSCSSLSEPAGTPGPNSSCPRTSRRSGCPRARPNSIPWKTSGSTCARLGSPTRLRNLPRHRRRRMRSLEQAHRPTRHHNFNRHAPVGSRRSEVRALGFNSSYGCERARPLAAT
jgi:hypothetical protein